MKKNVKPKYRKTWLFICYMNGRIDKVFHRNKGNVSEASFVSKRIASFTDFIANTMINLEENTIEFRNNAQIIMNNIDCSNSVFEKSIGGIRAKREIKEAQIKLIQLNGMIRAETIKSNEILLPYADLLKAQTIAYSHGFNKPITESAVDAMYSVEKNNAFIAYQQANAGVDDSINEYVNKQMNLKEK